MKIENNISQQYNHINMPTLYYTDYSNPDFTQQRVVSNFLNIELKSELIQKKYQPLNFVDGNLILNESNAISVYLASSSKLLGDTFQHEVQVYSWLEYFNIQIHPLLKEIYAQVFGKTNSNKKKYDYANQQFKRIIKVLEQRFKFRTFIVGNSITLADIIYCCQLQNAFRLLITPQMRKKFVNLCRWFTFIRSQQPFISCLGKMYLCQNLFNLQFSETNDEEVKQSPKHQQSHKQQVKKQQSKQGKKKQKQQKQQQKNDEKQGKFNLDKFKRNFQNSDNKQAVINELLQTFPEGWSIWKIYYNKDVTEGKIDYLTSNLAKGTLQRLQGLRKTGFGNWGVYYSNQTQQYEIRGVMLWKGDQIAEAWKEHPSFQYHIFAKLDTKNPNDQKIIKDYWLESQVCEGLTYHNSSRLV